MEDFGESIELEHKVAKIIQRQHEKGFMIDVVGAHMLQAKFKEDMNNLQQIVRKTFPPLKIETEFIPKVNNKAKGYVKGKPFTKVKFKEFNLGSRQQIGERLIMLGWKPKKKTDKGHIIVDEKVLSAIKKVPRELFVEEHLIKDAYQNNALLTDCGQTERILLPGWNSGRNIHADFRQPHRSGKPERPGRCAGTVFAGIADRRNTAECASFKPGFFTAAG